MHERLTAPSTSVVSFVKPTRVPLFARNIEFTPSRTSFIGITDVRDGVLVANVICHCFAEFYFNNQCSQ